MNKSRISEISSAKRKLNEISSVRSFLKILNRFKPPDRILTRKWIIFIIISYLLIMLPLVGYGIYKFKKEEKKDRDSEKPSAVSPMVKAVRVKLGNFDDTLAVNGTVKGTSEVELKFEIQGKIASFNFREGDFVSKGEIIVSLESEDVMTRLRHAKSKYQSTNSRYEAAKEKLGVYRELYEMGAIIKAKLNEMELTVDGLKSEVDTARAEVILAQSQLDKTVIAALEDGVMGSRKVEIGDFLTPNDVAGMFLEVQNVYVEMGVIEKDIEKINVGQKVKVEVDAYSESIFWGRVDNISQMIRGETRTLPVKVIISNPGQRLISGMYADCQIYLAEFKNVIVIPTSSVINLGQMTVVPLVKTNDNVTGIIELRKIESKYVTASYTLVSDGLRTNDTIVMETQQPLKDGMNVKIIEIIEINIDD